MSGWPLWLALALALAGTLALAALFAAGRFAKLRRGAPSRALAPAGDTTLDALLDGPEAAHPGLSGARLVPAETEAPAEGDKPKPAKRASTSKSSTATSSAVRVP